MKTTHIFERDLSERLDESIRVDRNLETEDRLELLRQYHVTESAREFLTELFSRLQGDVSYMRQGWNNWLYGYYGSGKSHLLTVVGLLTDSDTIEEDSRDQVWEAFSEGNAGLEELRKSWNGLLDGFKTIPVFINLLKYQGQAERGFGEILLEAAHLKQKHSPRLQVAFFEDWYEDYVPRAKWAKRALDVLDDAGVSVDAEDVWPKVQRYRVLSDIVLPRLYMDVADAKESDGLRDVVTRDLRPEAVVQELEAWRKKLDAESDRDVKLVLLLDEISLFIGTQYNLLTELNSVAENIDEVGRGNIVSVVTAQEKIADVRTDYVPKAVSFGILSDRYPYQYNLPSSHVGRIVQRRLLHKSKKGRSWVIDNVVNQGVPPADAYIYSNVQQNTTPRLNDVDNDEFADYFPLLPYHPPLFLEILSNLRNRESETAKSIFSGTARAVLAIVKGLLEEWVDKRDEKELVNLVDFFDIIRPELENIIPDKLKTITAIENEVADGSLEELDSKVAKAVLLLTYVPNHIPLEAHNIAVSIMRDTQRADPLKMENRVTDSLRRLSTYIRPSENGGPHLRFTTPKERDILRRAAQIEKDVDWHSFAKTVEEHLWEDLLDRLDFQGKLSFPRTDQRYPVSYEFAVDGIDFGKKFGSPDGLAVPIAVRGLLPDDVAGAPPSPNEAVLEWTVSDKDRQGVRDQLTTWAALFQAANESDHVPESIAEDLTEQRHRLLGSVRGLLVEGSFRVQSDKGLSSISKALETLLDKRFPEHFHPEMSAVNQSTLSQLKGLKPGEPLPDWAARVGVSEGTADEEQGKIASKVWALTGRTLAQNGQELSVNRLLELIAEAEPIYEDAKPALIALIWGECRRPMTRFRVVGNDGSPVDEDVLLDRSRWHETRIQLFGDPDEDIREILERIPTVDPGVTIGEAFDHWRQYLNNNRQRLRALLKVVEYKDEKIRQPETSRLMSAFLDGLRSRRDEIDSQLEQLKQREANWDALADASLAVGNWIDGARETWDLRGASLFEFEALLVLQSAGFPWLTDKTDTELSKLRSELDDARNIEWWSEQGWSDLRDTVSSLPDARSAVREAWTAYCEDGDRLELFEAVNENPWFASLDGFYTLQVQDEFERAYLRPLRHFQNEFDRLRRGVEPLVDQNEADIDRLDRAVKALRTLAQKHEQMKADSEVAITELRTKWQYFKAVIGEYRPGDVAGVGMWPDDEPGLREVLRMVLRNPKRGTGGKLKDFELEQTDKGVIVR
ncbi:hypothetical protein FIV42_15345 [Persicimonas caeni]|uniref:BREX system P-loop protein BrxC n=1 Tax=Persicimonas caeni TaxID=2292766 RepID=A0A4Y6PVQ1_PERCE|nr:hypothetical protein [Persicimonas caeni]QDG52067.1 hypothetical protein FIV42_15345 [Persicimonas caeni]QED33288.1 hypothetical protein FRD00_15340 [Persicimonas caeni]